jgi:hypothetical protein
MRAVSRRFRLSGARLTRKRVRLIRPAWDQLLDVDSQVRPASPEAEAKPTERNSQAEQKNPIVVAQATRDHEEDAGDRNPSSVPVEPTPSRRRRTQQVHWPKISPDPVGGKGETPAFRIG